MRKSAKFTDVLQLYSNICLFENAARSFCISKKLLNNRKSVFTCNGQCRYRRKSASEVTCMRCTPGSPSAAQPARVRDRRPCHIRERNIMRATTEKDRKSTRGEPSCKIQSLPRSLPSPATGLLFAISSRISGTEHDEIEHELDVAETNGYLQPPKPGCRCLPSG